MTFIFRLSCVSGMIQCVSVILFLMMYQLDRNYGFYCPIEIVSPQIYIYLARLTR